MCLIFYMNIQGLFPRELGEKMLYLAIFKTEKKILTGVKT